MSVTPSAPLRTIISSEDYSLALKWWLGLPLFLGPEDERTCPGCCRPCDLFGDLLLCCERNNFSRRHNAVQEAIANLLQASGQGFTTEVKIPDCPDGELRPADILRTSYQNGCPTSLDLTVAHGWQSSERFSVTRERWRTFLKRKETLKHAKYDALCKAAGVSSPCPLAPGVAWDQKERGSCVVWRKEPPVGRKGTCGLFAGMSYWKPWAWPSCAKFGNCWPTKTICSADTGYPNTETQYSHRLHPPPT